MDSPQVLSSHENPCFEPRFLPYASIEAICRHGVHLAKALSANFPSEKGVKPITRTPGFPFASLYQQALEFAEHFERAFNPDRFPFGTPERDNFCVPIPVAKGGFEWLVSCFNTVLYTYGWQLLCDGHLSVEDVFQERFVKPRITIDTLPTFGNAIVDGLETASTALGSAVDQILASNSYPQELLAPLRQAGGSQKCSTHAAAAFGLGVGSHWPASDFLDEALPVLLAEFNTPSLHQLTQIAAARRDKKSAQLRNELVEGLAENAIPASDGARLWYTRGAEFGRRMIMLPAYPRLGAVLLAIKSGIAELPPELIAQLTTLQQIEGLTSDDRSDEESFEALFPAEAERTHAWCAQFERQESAVHLAGARTSLSWLDVANSTAQ
jgi:hypothetical protein